MNSMLRQHHIRFQDLEGYLRGYDPANKPPPQEEWAKTESAGFEPGMLIFCLDSVATPAGLTTFGKKDAEGGFGKKEAEAGETFRVRDLCIVTGKENGRPLVVSITASAYEQRFLEALMLEKARKAILDAREFYYVTAQPSKPLGDPTMKEIDRLGNVYAQGGSRRSLTVESSGPLEPAVALLAALGVRLSVPGGKQVLDIGSICHMLFASDGKQQEDKNRTLIKSCFTPVPSNTFGTAAPEVKSAGPTNFAEPPSASPVIAPSPPLVSKGAAEGEEVHADTEGFDYSLFGQLTEPPPALVNEHLQMGKGAQDKPASVSKAESVKNQDAAQGGALFDAFTPEELKAPTAKPPEKKTADEVATTSGTYKHLAEALSGLVDVEGEERPGKVVEIGQSPTPPPTQSDKGGSVKPFRSKDKAFEAEPVPSEAIVPALPEPASAPPEITPEPKTEATPEPVKASEDTKRTMSTESSVGSDRSSRATITGDHDVVPNSPKASKQPVAAETNIENAPASTSRSRDTASASVSSTSTPSYQEPQAVMNEMASLMSKLEQQVSKASKKLASRAEEIEQRLNRRTESLLDEASQDDKNTEASILVLCDSLTKQFEQLSEELRLKISDAAAAGRESIKSMQGTGQSQIEDNRTSKQENLLNECKGFRTESESLNKASEEYFNKIVTEQMSQAEALIRTVLDHLKDIADDFETRLNQRFKRFTERMAEESGAVINSIQRNVHSMEEEIDGSWERASEKLKSSQADFEQTIEHTLAATELSILQAARIILVEQFLPKLKERKEIVWGMAAEMATAFSEQSQSQTRSQLTGLDTSLASARQQLHTLAEECLARIDSVGRQQQAGLEELFKDTSGFMERSTADVLSLVEKTEQQIQDVEGVCKKLAETSSLDTDPHLTEERNSAVAKVQNLKGRLKAELDRTLEAHCTQLEQLGQTVQSQLNTRRIEQTQVIREASENGLNRIKEAIQEAFSAVQSAREKYME